MENNQLITKSPGKVLLCGGYLILSDKYSGIVLNTDSYFECRGRYKASNSEEIEVIVSSEDFGRKYHYRLASNEECVQITQLDGPENKFIQGALLSVYAFCLMEGKDDKKKTLLFDFVLKADYRFYSYCKDGIGNAKTGLGSSSALLSALISNFYLLLSGCANKTSAQVNQLDKELQFKLLLMSVNANSIAQNKVTI